MWRKWKPYLISILIALGVGGLSAFLTRGDMNLSGEIIFPPLSPPAFLFPIVWTILFLLMGISAGMIFVQKDKNLPAAQNGLFSYGASLVVNFFWSIIFFRFRAFTFAFFWLLCLLFLIVRTIYCYWRVSPLAAKLQIPYALWVTFAGYLNLGIAILNP